MASNGVGAGLLIALLMTAPGLSADDSADYCYIVDQSGNEYRGLHWNRLAVQEVLYHGTRGNRSAPGTGLDSPAGVSALLYRGVVIPIKDVVALLPELGIYVLKDGHLIEANALENCRFSKEHQFLDVEHQGYRSTPGDPESPSKEDVPLVLEVHVEVATTDTVAGYPVEGTRMIPIHHARIVVFDREAVDSTMEIWRNRTPMGTPAPFTPYSTRTKKRTDLRDGPEGTAGARVEEGTPVEVLELRGEWVRVKVEGWVQKKAVEEKQR